MELHAEDVALLDDGDECAAVLADGGALGAGGGAA